ncbi:MAG: carboxymuconolactone decarboxylase [Deltaproteobacteria bacterium RBG_13_58_19]|nr:MAG: carboxymuconolactone decarboxylase [Deltaproteobacteria bacterium RBG_13_58_19]
MARLPDPIGSLDPQAQELYHRLVAKRGRIDGMYRSLLNHPELTQHVSDLGTFLRFGAGVLPDAVRELTIIYLARRLGAAYEWVKHVPHAREAGVPEKAIEAIRQGQDPPELSEVQQGALRVAQCVLDRKSIPADLQDTLKAALGLKGVIELVVLCGFYQMIAGVIFAFDVPLPEGEREPFAPGST